jgi:alginate O-acetyltransferase complex protein AlgI
MVFNSIEFLILVGITFCLYYLPALRFFQVELLIVSSFVFYAWHAPWLLLLLITSIAVNSALGYAAAWRGKHRMRVIVFAGVVFNLGILGFFKYGPLAARTLRLAENGTAGFLLLMPLPIGISFYTFESISLLVDLFRHRTAGQDPFVPESKQRNLAHTALFFAFFPHLVSGPILKADLFYPQIGLKNFTNINWETVFKRCVVGFFLKMVVADNIKEVTWHLDYPNYLGCSTIVACGLLFAYSLQILSDFAGYSSIAIGIAAIFGYDLPENFNFPYFSASLGEFWRRWHISLSTWLREYLYFPLGGNRHGNLRTYFNLFTVMALGGLWHGGEWRYSVWGLWHGLGLAVERAWRDRPGNLWERFPRFIRTTLVFGFVTLGWLLFKLARLSYAVDFVGHLVQSWPRGPKSLLTLAVVLGLFSLPAFASACWRQLTMLYERFESLFYALLLACIVISPGLPGTFIYFQF